MTNIVKVSKKTNAPKRTVSCIVDKSRFMKRAHAAARTYKGDYIARLALAMRELYRKLDRHTLVASHRSVSDRYGIAEEVFSVMERPGVWKHVNISRDEVSLVEARPTKFDRDRHDRARALKNGLMHIRHEYNKAFNELTHAISVANAKGPKADIALMKAKYLELRCNKLLSDIKEAESYVPSKVRCTTSRNKSLDTKVRRFTDILFGTYEELSKLPA